MRKNAVDEVGGIYAGKELPRSPHSFVLYVLRLPLIRNAMNENQNTLDLLKSLGASVLLSATLVVPFIILQWVNRRTLQEAFPVVLFLFMSLHSLFIVFLLRPVLRHIRAERSLRALKFGHWVSLLLGAFLIYVYVGVVIDQLPCFLGVPNCD